MPLDLTEYKVLSFDIYGTLINWEKGIYEQLLELLGGPEVERAIGATSAEGMRHDLLSMYHQFERTLQKSYPDMSYQTVLQEIYNLIAERLELPADQVKAQEFGASIEKWPAFSDTVEAMQMLSRHYKLVVLSNVDENSFAGTRRGPLYGVKFDAIYIASAIGSYKPDLANFEYLIEHVRKDFGVEKDKILHVAHSLLHDHVPAKKIGLRPGVWIERRGRRAIMNGDVDGLIERGRVDFGATYKNLGEFAMAAEKAFEGRRK
ncbi:hypothetical protein BP5796_04256 [Coleophoma crateriformis]|uniref:Uncharacterized protein n=1 Tax=Coleophoma crateriformis TaxID=565419 RepID=A0A3D8SID2_9HELO|nr:hypothetical protein BP5796_04256 [Coleophoma crateriformis]